MEPVSYSIIEKCRNGCAESFSQIVAVYERRIFSYVFRLVYNTHLANETEDIVQEVFLKVYNQINGYRSSGNSGFNSWIYTIARNHCISCLRKKTSLSQTINIEDVPPQNFADNKTVHASDAAIGSEISGRVAEAVSKLPEDQKNAFILRYYEDLSYEEIADILDVNIGTLKSRISRAKDSLQGYLKDYISNR